MTGGLIGWLFFMKSSPYYSSYMIAEANGTNSTDMINYINDLHELCARKNVKALAYNLEVPDSSAAKVKDIQAHYIIDINKDGIGDRVDLKNEFNYGDTTRKIMENRFYVAVEVFDNGTFETVRRGLYNYIGNNPYIINLNEIRKKELGELIAQTDKEINKLDSLQNVDYFQDKEPVRTSDMMFISEKEKRMYYHDILRLLEDRQEYQKELELSDNTFTIVKDFTSLTLAEKTWKDYVKKYGLVFLLLGYVLLLSFRFRDKLSKLFSVS